MAIEKVNALKVERFSKSGRYGGAEFNKCSKTFNQCVVEYIAHHKNGWKSIKHLKQWESSLSTYALPHLGEMPADEINTALVLQVLKPIWFKKTETASRLRERIERVLSWATVCGYRTGDNPARWNGHLQEVLPRPSRIKTVRHHSAMAYQEIKEFFGRLNIQEGIGARALEFTILTACRTTEVLHARWQEIDFARRIWTVPAMRMKNGKRHRVPLSDAALTTLHALEGNPKWVFPNLKQDGPIYEAVMFEQLRRMNRPDITVHGFRATFRIWAAERTGYAREIAEMALSHKQTSAVERAYQRSDLFELRRALMQDWADWVLSRYVAPRRSASRERRNSQTPDRRGGSLRLDDFCNSLKQNEIFLLRAILSYVLDIISELSAELTPGYTDCSSPD